MFVVSQSLKCYSCSSPQTSGCSVDIDPDILATPIYTQTCPDDWKTCVVRDRPTPHFPNRLNN